MQKVWCFLAHSQQFPLLEQSFTPFLPLREQKKEVPLLDNLKSLCHKFLRKGFTAKNQVVSRASLKLHAVESPIFTAGLPILCSDIIWSWLVFTKLARDI